MTDAIKYFSNRLIRRICTHTCVLVYTHRNTGTGIGSGALAVTDTNLERSTDEYTDLQQSAK